MITLRSNLMMSLALGMAAGVFAATSAAADDKPGQTDAKHHDHEHDAAKIEKEITTSLAELSAADRKLAQAQRFCTMMIQPTWSHGQACKGHDRGQTCLRLLRWLC